jgi:hypothetical protein
MGRRSMIAAEFGRTAIALAYADLVGYRSEAHNHKNPGTLETTMRKKTKNRPVLLAPKGRSSIPRSEILKAIKKVAAARRSRKQPAVSNDSK